MKTKIHLILLMTVFLFFISCNEEGQIANDDSSIDLAEIENKLKALQYNTDNLELLDIVGLDNVSRKKFLVGGDALLSIDQINYMYLSLSEEGDSKQFANTNLVNIPGATRTVRIMGYSGTNTGNWGLSAAQRTILQNIATGFNSLNLSLRFQVVFGIDHTNAINEIVVYNDLSGAGIGGFADFPTGGNPGKYVHLFGARNQNNAVNLHLMVHEIAHTIGMRHNDWQTRITCPLISQGNEGGNPNHVPGTGTTNENGSIFNACFNAATTTGNVTTDDIALLQFMY